MTRAGESFWRLHVELQALTPEQRGGVEGNAICERMLSQWDALPQTDKDEANERLRITSGGAFSEFPA